MIFISLLFKNMILAKTRYKTHNIMYSVNFKALKTINIEFSLSQKPTI